LRELDGFTSSKQSPVNHETATSGKKQYHPPRLLGRRKRLPILS
jgi:hypothetical protein